MIRILYNLHRSALKYPKAWILALVFSGLFPSLFYASKLKTLNAIEDIVDADFVTTPHLKRLNSLFDDRNNLIVLFQKDTAFSVEELCVLKHWISTESSVNPSIIRVASPFSIRQAKEDKDHLWYFPVLNLNCHLTNLSDVNTKVALKDLEHSPWSGIFVPYTGAEKDLMVDFYLRDQASGKGDASCKKGCFDSKQVDEIKSSFEKNAQSKIPNVKAIFSGAASFQYYTDEGYKMMDLLNLALAVFLVGLFYLFFGTLKSSVVLLTTLVSTFVLLKGVMGYAGIAVDILSSNLFLMLTVSCIQDFLFLTLVQKKKSWQEGYRSILVPSFFTSLTTTVGFFSLMASDLSIIRHFGILAGAGAMIEWAMVFLFLPALAKQFKFFRTWTKSESVPPTKDNNPRRENALQRTSDRFLKFLSRSLDFEVPRGIAFLSVIVFPLCVVSLSKLTFLEFPEKTFLQNHPFRKSIRNIHDSRGFSSISSLVFEPGVSEQRKNEIHHAVKGMAGLSKIEQYRDILDFSYRNVRPESKQVFQREFFSSNAMDRYLAETGEERMILYWQTSEANSMNRSRIYIDELCKGDCFLAGSLVSYGEFGSRVRDTLFEGLGISLIIVSIILGYFAWALKFRQLGWLMLVLCVSSFWGPACIFVGLWLFKIPVTFVSCLFATTLVGLAGDNAIQFLWAGRKANRKLQDSDRCSAQMHAQDTSQDTSMMMKSKNVKQISFAALIIMMSNIGISLMFLGAYFQPARTLGLLLSGGFILLFFGDYWIFKSLLSRIRL